MKQICRFLEKRTKKFKNVLEKRIKSSYFALEKRTNYA